MALLLSNGGQTLRLEELNAIALIAKVGLQADQDDWGRWAEVQNLGVPLGGLEMSLLQSEPWVSVPYPSHFPRTPGSQWQSRQTKDPSQGRIRDANGHIPPGRQYPKAQAQRSCPMLGG